MASERIPCRLCGRTRTKLRARLAGFEVRECECGRCFLDPEPSAVEMEPFDDGAAYDHYFGLRDAIVAQHHRTLTALAQVRAPGRLLDVGCGTGFFLEAARSRGWQGVGVDPSPFAIEKVRALGFDGYQGMLEDIEGLEPGSFDALALLQVVEHVPDPGPLLDACRALLAPGGALLVATPNPDGWLAHAKKDAWNYWIPPMHCVWYPPQALARLLAKHGFRVASRSTWSARADGLHDGVDLIDRTPARRAPLRGKRLVGEGLVAFMDLVGKGSIVEQIGVMR